MVLINDNWEQIRDLQDVSNIIRKYYNEELADELDNLIPEHTDEDYWSLESDLYDAENNIASLEDEISYLENKVECLEEAISDLKESIFDSENNY